MAIKWTLQEVQEILTGIDLPAGTLYDWDALLERIGEAVDADAISEQLVANSIAGAATPEALAAATAQAQRQTRKIAGNLARAELQKIAQKVRENIEAGQAFDKLAGQLSEIAGLDKARAGTLTKYKDSLIKQGIAEPELSEKVERMRAKLLSERRKTIAQTEQRFATSEGAANIAAERGAQYKVWITAGDDRVSDMDEENEAAGWIKFDEPFPSGDMQPPSHPNCRCTVAYRKFEPNKQDEARAKAAAQATTEAKQGN